MARIERLVVENYRGASTSLELDFDASKPLSLVFGENGTGKSTIADAIDAVGNGSKGSLQSRSSTKARDHLPTIGKKPADIRIHLTAGKSTWSATLSGDTLTTTPQPRPKVRVLRRQQIRLLVEAEPAKRYEQLRNFIDVSKVETAENTLREAAKGARDGLDTAARDQVEANAQLLQVWEDEGKPAPSARQWADALALEDAGQMEAHVEQLRNMQRTIELTEASHGRQERDTALVAESSTELLALGQPVEKLPQVNAAQAMDLADILRNVARHLEAGKHPDKCPVCEQGIPLANLRSDIHRRLAELAEHEALKNKLDAATRKIRAAEEAAGKSRTEVIQSARALLDAVGKGRLEQLEASGLRTTDYTDLSTPESASALSAAVRVVKAFGALKQALANEELSTTKRSGKINLVRTLLKRMQAGAAIAEQLDQLRSRMAQAHETVRKTRIAFTQKILDEVSDECGRLYGLVHPGERISISRLELDPDERASINQKATFEGHKDVPPQAYFSDSHLDTLGFCFWLATIKRENPNADAVVVIDDVFTSVDAQHLSRLAQLLVDESSHFAQVIATTHQRLWRDTYRHHRGPGKLVHLVELQRWTLAKGISSFRTRLAVDELAASIVAGPFDRQGTAVKAGVLLESMLDYLALQYRCRVARTPDGANTLGELLDATEGLFKKLEVHCPEFDATGNPASPPEYVAAAPAVIGWLRSLSFIRNQVGAHFNVAGTEIPDADVQSFASLAVGLAEALSCKICGQVPGKSTGSHFRCSCTPPKETRMLPLQLV